jgi:hypothetical protein
MTDPTPIFHKTLDDWLDSHEGRIPGDVEHAPVKAALTSTPLMDDVEEHGVGPWDEQRRKDLGSPVVNIQRKSGAGKAPRRRAAARR